MEVDDWILLIIRLQNQNLIFQFLVLFQFCIPKSYSKFLLVFSVLIDLTYYSYVLSMCLTTFGYSHVFPISYSNCLLLFYIHLFYVLCIWSFTFIIYAYLLFRRLIPCHIQISYMSFFVLFITPIPSSNSYSYCFVVCMPSCS